MTKERKKAKRKTISVSSQNYALIKWAKEHFEKKTDRKVSWGTFLVCTSLGPIMLREALKMMVKGYDQRKKRRA